MSPIVRTTNARRLVLLSAVALLLAACAAPAPPPTAQDLVFQAKSNYEALLVDAVKYRQRPACRTIVSVPPRIGVPVAVKEPVRAPVAIKTAPGATRTAAIETLKPAPRNVAAPVVREPVSRIPIEKPVAVTLAPTLVAETDPATCANPRVVDLMRSADNAAEAVIDNAETTVRDVSTTPVQQNEAVAAAQNSVASFDHVLTQYGVK